jgi:hypothetical protein
MPAAMTAVAAGEVQILRRFCGIGLARDGAMSNRTLSLPHPLIGAVQLFRAHPHRAKIRITSRAAFRNLPGRAASGGNTSAERAHCHCERRQFARMLRAKNPMHLLHVLIEVPAEFKFCDSRLRRCLRARRVLRRRRVSPRLALGRRRASWAGQR